MAMLTARLFGRFAVRRGELAFEDLITGKAKELFCYLLVHRNHRLPREVVAEVLWCECPREHSLKYLRKALWQLQSAVLGPSRQGPALFQADQDSIGLDPNSGIWIDIAEFDEAFARVSECLQHQDGSLLIERLESAVELYQGDFLEGWYQDWCLYERERLQNMYLAMLDTLMAHFGRQGDYVQALRYSMRLLQIDRAHEDAYRHLMRLRYMMGDKAGALREYERCCTALKEELGVTPSARTRELCEQIRSDRLPSLNCDTIPTTTSFNRDPIAPDPARYRLEELRTALAALESAAQRTLRAVSELLRTSAIRQPSTYKTPTPIQRLR